MRTPVIAGNWKMYKTIGEAVGFTGELKSKTLPSGCLVVVCPSFMALPAVSAAARGSVIELGAQNMHHASEGAYTGEISPDMLKDAGCSYVILGHSERRQFFGETDSGVNAKVFAALNRGLIPIVCVGESLSERESGNTEKVVEGQVRASLAGMGPRQAEDILVAYEPVWAIGTGKTASASDAQKVNGFIRGLLEEMFGPEAAQKIRILYGGSVKPDNTAGLMRQPDIDGALVGGASLDVESFAAIIHAAAKCGD
ncbi:MAG: triosephosphate isomerase [Peptococcaceae bacterium BICA1-7]|nr:MAG: triosephosphate isomerase [Peptococcaceae bacterium BICA1-7]HBV99088.1 triose-phosphate isomerase [Desulfotomaculum sp.]